MSIFDPCPGPYRGEELFLLPLQGTEPVSGTEPQRLMLSSTWPLTNTLGVTWEVAYVGPPRRLWRRRPYVEITLDGVRIQTASGRVLRDVPTCRPSGPVRQGPDESLTLVFERHNLRLESW